jgi:hypothetical protein
MRNKTRRKRRASSEQADELVNAEVTPLTQGSNGKAPELPSEYDSDNISSKLAKPLFKSWLAMAEITAFRLMLWYFAISMTAAFILGYVSAFEGTERIVEETLRRIKFALHVVTCLTIMMLIIRFRHLIFRKKNPTFPPFGLKPPTDLQILSYVEELNLPEWFLKLDRSKTVKTFTEALKDEFTYWNDRLKNSSVIILAAGVFLGIQYRTETWFLDIVGIITSWSFIVSLQMSSFTQRSLRFLKGRLLRIEAEEAKKQ